MPDSRAPEITVPPMDVHNRTLVDNVHPPDWVNPEPASRYNLVVIGGGTAGLVAAAGTALLGGKVALIEKDLLGGDCLNAGCVPSKTLIRSGRAWTDVHEARHFGIRIPDGSTVDFPAVMERLRRVRAGISPHDSAQEFTKRGVDVFLGAGRFTGPDTIEVAGKILRFKKAVIATGARAARPAIEGLEEAGYLTNETVFSLTELPGRLAVIGGGPLGCELAQAFGRLGSEVVLLHKHSALLDGGDADAAGIIEQTFKDEGLRLVLDAQIKRVTRSATGKVIHFEASGQAGTVEVDTILVGAGRTPNVEGLNLEAVGVRYDKREGIVVDDRLQTTNSRIYACGDVCMKWKFTHAADAAARIVIENALFFGFKKLSTLTMPWCTYTDPEVAHVGLYEREAQQHGISVETFFAPLEETDRAATDGEADGFAKIHVRRGTDKIVGATIVARHAGEMINELTLAMVARKGLGTLSKVIHPYPTRAEVIRRAADHHSLGRLGQLQKLSKVWLAWTR
ncbi:MAG: mercuric reductase [Gemmatimonadaceae bacterium]|nr:mercuric reductase [Gloeobacterales cyanobacterium ES-bin-141]